MAALKGGSGGLRAGVLRVYVSTLVWDNVFVYICAVWWGGGRLIVMHLDGFRDTSFQKQGPH